MKKSKSALPIKILFSYLNIPNTFHIIYEITCEPASTEDTLPTPFGISKPTSPATLVKRGAIDEPIRSIKDIIIIEEINALNIFPFAGIIAHVKRIGIIPISANGSIVFPGSITAKRSDIGTIITPTDIIVGSITDCP